MAEETKTIVVVGGGTAGWLLASLVAAQCSLKAEDVSVQLIESPDIAPVGVGEGTWPTMAGTLSKIGLSESDFIRCCDASFKQGSKFIGWVKGGGESYYHPFSLPTLYDEIDLVPHWAATQSNESFAHMVCPQSAICDEGLAPKQIQTPEFARVLNYGYHLDAAKFSILLQSHAVGKLGVEHILDAVVSIESDDCGYVKQLKLKTGRVVEGDLFIDCTGMRSLLIGGHFGVPYVDKRHILFNDTALAVQVPYTDKQSPIASCTHATAQSAGWVWDIGLFSRRGVGRVYSSAHTREDQAFKELDQYLRDTGSPEKIDNLNVRKISFTPGHRAKFWVKNCVAVGLSAGFIDPLEATALVLVEQSAQMIADELPRNRRSMEVVADRFNQRFGHHWSRIIDFIKLHYVLTERHDSEYWRDHLRDDTVPDSLRDSLVLWRDRSPSIVDNVIRGELFPSVSFQYVLYGMQPSLAPTFSSQRRPGQDAKCAMKVFSDNALQQKKLLGGLPSNRSLLDELARRNFGSTR